MSDSDLLEAPCVFCGYNGSNYWQSGSHEPHCCWSEIGGFEERRQELRGLIQRVVQQRDDALWRLTAPARFGGD